MRHLNPHKRTLDEALILLGKRHTKDRRLGAINGFAQVSGMMLGRALFSSPRY